MRKMAWRIRLLGGRELMTADEINRLQDYEIEFIELVLDGRHFDNARIADCINRCKNVNGSTKPVCNRIVQSLGVGVFKFDLFRQMSGWLCTNKTGGEEVALIIRHLFYGELFDRFTEQNNQNLINGFREIFLPWLIRILGHQAH
jgi:hypothetical protein